MHANEDKLQEQCANAIDKVYPKLWWWHTPNGGMRHKLIAYRLKRMGVKPGVFDITVAEPSALYHGLFIELKTPENKNGLSTAQKEFGAAMAQRGYAVSKQTTVMGVLNCLKLYLANHTIELPKEITI